MRFGETKALVHCMLLVMNWFNIMLNIEAMVRGMVCLVVLRFRLFMQILVALLRPVVIFIVILIMLARCTIVMLQVNIDTKLVLGVRFIVMMIVTVLLKLMIHDYLSMMVFRLKTVI